MQEQKQLDRIYSTSNPNRFKLTKINQDMQQLNPGNLQIAAPKIVLGALDIIYTKCVDMLKLNIGITYYISIFKRQIKFITQSEDESNEIEKNLNEFIKNHAETGMLIKVGSDKRKEQNLIERWNVALKKLYTQNQIDLNTLTLWTIPTDESTGWFASKKNKNSHQTVNSLAINTSEDSTSGKKTYFESMKAAVEYLEKKAKSQGTIKKGDDAKTNLTNFVVKTAATLNTAKTFFADAANVNDIENMLEKLEQLVAKAKLGDLNLLLKEENNKIFVSAGKEDFKNMLPEKIKNDYGDGKTFASEGDKCYVKVWYNTLNLAKTVFTNQFDDYKKTIKTITAKIDDDARKQVKLADNTRTMLREKQMQIHAFKIEIEKNKQNFIDITPGLYTQLDNFHQDYDLLLKDYGELNNTDRVALRECYLTKETIALRDLARKKFYELYSCVVTVSAELESGKKPSYSSLDLEILSNDLAAATTGFSGNVAKEELKLISIPTSSSNKHSDLSKRLEELSLAHKKLLKLCEETLKAHKTLWGKIKNVLRAIAPMFIIVLLSGNRKILAED